MKKCIKILFLSIILVVMSGWYYLVYVLDLLSKSLENWMSKFDDGKYLIEINILGLYDSGLFILKDLVKLVWVKI